MQSSLDSENASVLQKVTSWLDQQAKKFKDDVSRKEIGHLAKNLIGSQLRIENINANEKWIEVPLADTFHTQYPVHEPTLKMLLIREVSEGFIIGQIVEIIPQGQHYKEIPLGLLKKLDNDELNEFNGSMRIFSITNKHLVEKNFKQKHLYFIKRISEKKDNTHDGVSTANRNPPPIGEDCTDWYWVTTYFYADGTSEEIWEYLYTTCDEGGGGDTGTSPNYHDEDYSDEIEEQDNGTEDPDGTVAGAPPIIYSHEYTLQYANDEVFNVIRYPVTASPMISNYVRNGWNTTRTLSLMSQYSSWTPVGPTSGWISWSCIVNAHYNYIGSGVTGIKQWTHTHTKVY